MKVIPKDRGERDKYDATKIRDGCIVLTEISTIYRQYKKRIQNKSYEYAKEPDGCIVLTFFFFLYLKCNFINGLYDIYIDNNSVNGSSSTGFLSK